jgi:hypothetical protein
MKNIKKFEQFVNESIEPVDYVDINIDDEFENELTVEEQAEMNRTSRNASFDEKEIMKLNLYFGIYKKSESFNVYLFKKKHGSFGTPRTNLNGSIGKRIDDDRNIFYIMELFINMTVGPSKGNRYVLLKFNNLDEIVKFFKSFE